MEYSEFVNDDKFKELFDSINILPISICSDNEYLIKLKEVLDEYRIKLKEIDFSAIDIYINENRVKRICEIIITAIEYQLNGNTVKAISMVEKLFKEKDIGDDLFTCILEESEANDFTKQLYRGRVGEEIYNLSEMFHVPFNKRQYVATERYSIPGYPCLYLSGSIYGSWLELNKPSINNFYVSRYEVSERLKVLDLSLLPRDIISGSLGYGNEYMKKYNIGEEIGIGEVILKYIYTWPIICASSFIIDEKNRTFKSEYILPQLLLQVIRNFSDESNFVQFDGIKYFSTKCQYGVNVQPNPIYINYVFISDNGKKYLDKSGNEYSKKLSHKFKLTPPANAYICSVLNEKEKMGLSLQDYNMNKKVTDIKKDMIRGKAFIEIMKGHLIQYGGLDFYRLEELLCKISAEKLEDEDTIKLR